MAVPLENYQIIIVQKSSKVLKQNHVSEDSARRVISKHALSAMYINLSHCSIVLGKQFTELNFLKDSLAVTKTATLSSKTGIGRSTLHSYIESNTETKSKVTCENLMSILDAFPEVNRDWLVFGDVEMLETKSYKIIAEPMDKCNDKCIKEMEDMVIYLEQLGKSRKETAEARTEIIECLRGHLAQSVNGQGSKITKT